MGCIISSRKKKPATKGSSENRPHFRTLPSETVIANDDQSQKASELLKMSDQLGPKELKREESFLLVDSHPRSSELAASGWPPWLISVAGEALVGLIPGRECHFQKQEQIGGGTFSKVFKARDLLRNKTVALKRIRFDLNDSESIKLIAREIIILRKLDHPNVIKLEGLMLIDRDSSSLYMIFEYMEHDLLGLSSLLGANFSEPEVKCYMMQLLRGLDHCHTNHVLHRDIKSSNLLINGNGVLKIADFGLSTFFDPHNSVPLTTHVVTLWYRPPELLLGASHYGVGIDLWSTGCVIGELYAGKPILPGKNETEQLHKIFKLCGSPKDDYWTKLKLQLPIPLRPMFPYGSHIAETFKEFPAPVISLLETLLSIDPDFRGTAATALKSEYFKTEPLACDPSYLPKYPPSKEINIIMRDETRKQASQIRRTDEPQAVQPIVADSSLTRPVQRDSRSNENSFTESYEEEETSSLQEHSARQMITAEENSFTESSEEDGTSGLQDHSARQMLTAEENSFTESSEEDGTSSLQDHSARQMLTAEENSFTKSSEEDGTSSLQDHSARQMLTAKDMITNGETGEEGSYTDPSRQNQNLGGSMNMEEHIPWPMSPSKINPTEILPNVNENGTSSSGRVGIRHTLVDV